MKAGRSRKFQILLFCVGLLVLFWGIRSLMSRIDLSRNGDTVDALITSIEVVERDEDESGNDHYVHVEYEYQGQTYKEVTLEYDFTMKEGKTVKLYVDPENPESFVFGHSLYLNPILIILVGIGCCVLGIYSGVQVSKKEKASV